MATEASCKKFLDVLAIEFFIESEFPENYGKPMIGDVLAAFCGKSGKTLKTDNPITSEPNRYTEERHQCLENSVNIHVGDCECSCFKDAQNSDWSFGQHKKQRCKFQQINNKDYENRRFTK